MSCTLKEYKTETSFPTICSPHVSKIVPRRPTTLHYHATVIPVHRTKAYGGNGRGDPLILNIGT